jgi:hypothetical protein
MITGTVIHGTLRPEDLAPVYLDLLGRLSPDHIGTDWYKQMDDEVLAVINSENDDPYGLLERLGDEIDAVIPEGYYFGSHPGDGSDIGIWQVEDD